MYEVLNTFKWNPIPKFQWKLINFEKSQNFSKKTLKPRFQNMKCMNEKELKAYQVKRNLKKLEESLRNKFGVRWECFGRETEKYREREIEEKWFPDRTEALYRAGSKSRQMKV